jgi:PilZ domain
MPRVEESSIQGQAGERWTGFVHDIGAGGVQIHCRTALQAGDFVRCELVLPGLPVAIPTLMQVCWTISGGSGYASGLKYVV